MAVGISIFVMHVLSFADFAQVVRKAADGDSETHWYLCTLAGTGYHRVEVQFGHG